MGKTGITIATLMIAGGMASSATAMGVTTPFIIEGTDGASRAATAPAQVAPVLRSSSVVTLGDDTVTQRAADLRAAPAVAAYSAVPAAPLPAPSLLPPPPAPMAAAPMMHAMPPLNHYASSVDRRAWKRAMKQRRAYERALRRCGSDCRTLLARQGHKGHQMAWSGHAPSAYYGAPMQPPAPVVTRGEVPGMAGATYEQTQYAGHYGNGYYYPGQTVTKITIDPGTMVVTQPAPTVSTYYAAPARAATPRRAKATRYRSKLIRRCAC